MNNDVNATHTIVQIGDARYLLPTEMLAAVVGDARSAKQVNESAAEQLTYELLDVVTHEPAEPVSLAAMVWLIARVAWGD